MFTPLLTASASSMNLYKHMGLNFRLQFTLLQSCYLEYILYYTLSYYVQIILSKTTILKCVSHDKICNGRSNSKHEYQDTQKVMRLNLNGRQSAPSPFSSGWYIYLPIKVLKSRHFSSPVNPPDLTTSSTKPPNCPTPKPPD